MPESFSAFVKENASLLREYVDVRLEIFRLRMVRMASRTLSLVITAFIISMLGLFILLFLGLTFSAWISQLSGSPILGYAATAGLYLVLLILVILLRKPMLQNPLIRVFLSETVEGQIEPAENDVP